MYSKEIIQNCVPYRFAVVLIITFGCVRSSWLSRSVIVFIWEGCVLGRTAGLWTQSQPERMSGRRALPVIHTLKGYHPNLQGPLPTHQSFPTGPLPRTDQPCTRAGHQGYLPALPLLPCPLYPYQYPYPPLKPQRNVFQGLSVTLPFKSCHSGKCVRRKATTPCFVTLPALSRWIFLLFSWNLWIWIAF